MLGKINEQLFRSFKHNLNFVDQNGFIVCLFSLVAPFLATIVQWVMLDVYYLMTWWLDVIEKHKGFTE